MFMNVNFALKLSNYTSLKRFICLKYILKNFSTILHSQLKHCRSLPMIKFKVKLRKSIKTEVQILVLL